MELSKRIVEDLEGDIFSCGLLYYQMQKLFPKETESKDATKDTHKLIMAKLLMSFPRIDWTSDSSVFALVRFCCHLRLEHSVWPVSDVLEHI